jgi:hypothetical protein
MVRGMARTIRQKGVDRVWRKKKEKRKGKREDKKMLTRMCNGGAL